MHKGTEINKAKLALLGDVFWVAKERKMRTRNNGITKRNIFSSLSFGFNFHITYAIFNADLIHCHT